MQVVVLGMHRSGTSLLSSILVDLGVNMGDDLFMRGKNQPHGHWEDKDFVSLNQEILKAAGGRWNNPPSRDAIMRVKDQFDDRIQTLVHRQKNTRAKWGWKDPRTCLTIDLYHPHLVNPRYIRIVRDKDAIVESLKRRHQGGKWGDLCDMYNHRTNQFLSSQSAWITVSYDALIDKRTQRGEVTRINDWIDGNGKIAKAMGRVKT